MVQFNCVRWPLLLTNGHTRWRVIGVNRLVALARMYQYYTRQNKPNGAHDYAEYLVNKYQKVSEINQPRVYGARDVLSASYVYCDLVERGGAMFTNTRSPLAVSEHYKDVERSIILSRLEKRSLAACSGYCIPRWTYVDLVYNAICDNSLSFPNEVLSLKKEFETSRRRYEPWTMETFAIVEFYSWRLLRGNDLLRELVETRATLQGLFGHYRVMIPKDYPNLSNGILTRNLSRSSVVFERS